MEGMTKVDLKQYLGNLSRSLWRNANRDWSNGFGLHVIRVCWMTDESGLAKYISNDPRESGVGLGFSFYKMPIDLICQPVANPFCRCGFSWSKEGHSETCYEPVRNEPSCARHGINWFDTRWRRKLGIYEANTDWEWSNGLGYSLVIRFSERPMTKVFSK